MMRNKGSILDIIVMVTVIFALGIVILVGTKLKDEFLPELKSAINSTAGKGTIDEVEVSFGILDYVFLIVAVGMGLAGVVKAFLIPTHPVFFFISIFLIKSH